MGKKIINHFKRRWQEYAGAGIILAIVSFFLIFQWGIIRIDLSYPFSYYGGDDISVLVDAKLLQHQNWVFSTDRLGAPYGAIFYDFSASMLHNVGLLLLKIFVLITGGNVGLAVNLLYLSIFYIAGLISYGVMRELKINWLIAAFSSSVFGLSPFIFLRGIGHIVLAECYFIPLSILLCLWIFERDDVFQLNKNFFKTPRNYAAVFFALLIANNGIAYYPFFTCYLIVITAISKVLKTRDAKHFLRALIPILCICFFFALNFVPSILYDLKNGANTNAVVRDSIYESELYGLKVTQLFMPFNGHGIPVLEKVINAYNTQSCFINENITSYIGVMGIIGFIVLMLSLFMYRDTGVKKRLGILSEMNIMLILFASTGSFSTIFSMIVGGMIRSYNRISIFIAYVCILAFAVAANAMYDKITLKKGAKIIPRIFLAGAAIFSLFCAWEGVPRKDLSEYGDIVATYDSDREFIKDIENSVDKGAQIFQLPYHDYPEGGWVNEMGDYHLYVGVIHSDTLKWSYAAVKGRVGADWCRGVAALEPSDMVNEIKKAGFSGVYIDRRAYTAEELEKLEGEMTLVTGHKPMVSNNGKLSFYKIS